MDVYLPHLVIHRKTSRRSPTLGASQRHSFERMSSSATFFTDGSNSYHEELDITTHSPHQSLFRSTAYQCPYETANMIDSTHLTTHMSSLGNFPMDRGENMAYTIRARMDSDTLPNDMDARSRNSSVYTTDSTFSTETTGTTISDIVEMYRGVTLKKSSDESVSDEPCGIRTHEPQAYRDTLIPLLQRRFSFDPKDTSRELSSGSYEHRSVGNIVPQHIQPASSNVSEKATRVAPSFTDFSRKLQNRKAEMESPAIFVSSMCQSRRRCDSGVSGMVRSSLDEPKGSSHKRPLGQVRSKSTSLEQMSDAAMIPRPLNISRRERIPSRKIHKAQSTDISKPNESSQDAGMVNKLQVQPRSPSRGRRPHMRESYEQQHVASELAREESYRCLSCDTTSIGRTVNQAEHSLGRQPGSTSSRRSKLRKRDQRSSEEKADYASKASMKRSASARHPERTKSWTSTRRNSMKAGISDVVRRLSMKSPTNTCVPPLPPQPLKHAAIPRTPYQIYGPKAFEEEVKQELKEERRRVKEELKLERTRRSLEKKEIANHQRTASGKSTSSIGNVFEGWRHSLTRSSSERRRERLKASIVIIGPTTLTAENNAAGGMI